VESTDSTRDWGQGRVDEVDGCFPVRNGIQYGEEQVVGKEPMLVGVDHHTLGGLEERWLDTPIAGTDGPGNNSPVEWGEEAVVHGIEVVEEEVERNMAVEVVALGTNALVGTGAAGEPEEVLVVEQKVEQIEDFQLDHCQAWHRTSVFPREEVALDLR
jgi:hypothetical protein